MFDQTLYLQPGDKVTIHRDGKEVEVSTTTFVRVTVHFDPYADFIEHSEPLIPAFDEK